MHYMRLFVSLTNTYLQLHQELNHSSFPMLLILLLKANTSHFGRMQLTDHNILQLLLMDQN